jgi:hypothetical protein
MTTLLYDLQTSHLNLILDMRVPPKKSTAARKSKPSDGEDGKIADTDGLQTGSAEGKKDGKQPDENEDDVKDYFDPIIIDSKRKRSTPQAEKTLREW